MTTTPYLPDDLPRPVPAADGLDAPYWAATRRHELVVQRCRACRTWQWTPEWVCHRCLSDDLGWAPVAPEGRIYSWERVWHPAPPAVAPAVPYLVVLVELPYVDGVRMVGNLLGDPLQLVTIEAPVAAVFEDHDEADAPFTLVQWELTPGPPWRQ